MWPFLVHRRHGPSITTSRIPPRKRIPPPLTLHKKTIPPLAYTHTKKKSLKSAADPIGIRPAKLCVRVVCLLRRCGVSSFLVRRFLFFLFFLPCWRTKRIRHRANRRRRSRNGDPKEASQSDLLCDRSDYRLVATRKHPAARPASVVLLDANLPPTTSTAVNSAVWWSLIDRWRSKAAAARFSFAERLIRHPIPMIGRVT